MGPKGKSLPNQLRDLTNRDTAEARHHILGAPLLASTSEGLSQRSRPRPNDKADRIT
jgi:hypothetical protein